MRSRKSKDGVQFLKEGKLKDLLEARHKNKEHFESNGKDYSYRAVSYSESKKEDTSTSQKYGQVQKKELLAKDTFTIP